MKIVLYSNYMNHHQLPLANAFNEIKDVEYIFVANTPFDKKRKAVGYEDMNRKYDFVLRAYENKTNNRIAHKLASEADIVMVGDSPLSYMMERLNQNKITFRAIERLFKNGTDLLHIPINLGRAYKHKLLQCQNKPLYFLAMSAYLAYDVNLFSKYPDRVFKWGYFIENRNLDYGRIANQREKNSTVKILWIGRLLAWKHPDVVIHLAKKLKEKKYSFECSIFGEGEMEKKLKCLIRENNLEESVRLNGFIPRDEVRRQMENADIFLFTSDFNEGWGAVLGEAMSSGCAVVSSHACGATPFLVKDGINGFIYQYGNEDSLLRKTEILLNNQELRYSMGKNALNSMRTLWNAETAANRLISLVNTINQGSSLDIFHDNGPCSLSSV